MRQYTKASSSVEPNSSEIYHIMNKIKANHLVFTKIQRNAFKYLFDKGIIFTIE